MVGQISFSSSVSQKTVGIIPHCTEKKTRILLPTYSHISECEQMVKNEVFKVQSLDDPSSWFEGLNKIKALIEHMPDADYCIKLLEDLCLLMYSITNSKTKVDYTIALVTFIKLRCGGPLFSSSMLAKVTSYFHTLFFKDGMEVQSVESIFDDAREYLDKYTQLKELPIFKKLYKFGMYALSLNLFEKLGVNFDTFSYSKVEAEAIKKQYCYGVDFVHSMLDTIVFLCQRGYQCMKTGSMDPIFHSGKEYQKWYDKVLELKRKSQLLSCPMAHGFSRHEYLADLRDAIEDRKSVV